MDGRNPHGCGLFRGCRGGKQGVSDVAGGHGMTGSSNEIPTKTVRTAVRKGRFWAEKRAKWQCKMRAGSAVVVPESCGFRRILVFWADIGNLQLVQQIIIHALVL